MIEPHVYELEPHPDYVVLVCDNTYKAAYAEPELAIRVFEGLRGEKVEAAGVE